MATPRTYLYEASKLSEARIQFALKCMQSVMQRKASENVVFSPYNIYEGLLMVYFASSGDTEIHLKRILQLPESIPKEDWMLHHQWDKNRINRTECKGYYDGNICWIKNTKLLKDFVHDIFNRTKWCLFDCSDIPQLMKLINKELKHEMLHYIRNPVELNTLNENMDCILSSVLRCKGQIFESISKDLLLPSRYLLKKPITVLSQKLGAFMTELPYINKTLSMFLLFPAVKSNQVPNKWESDQSISGLIERLTTEEGTDELRKVLDYPPQPSMEMLLLPKCFNLEYDLSIDELLEDLGIRQLLEPEHSTLSHFSRTDLYLGDAMHRAHIRMTPKNITTGAINLFFTKNEGSFKSIEDTNNSEYKQSFVWLIYDTFCHTILFIGVINCSLSQVSSSEYTDSSSNI